MLINLWPRRLGLLLLCTVAALPSRAQDDRAVQRVLFIGNSYVYYNNLPELVEAIAAELDGPLLQTEAHTHGGFTLQAHLDDGHVEELLKRGDPDGEPWTAVILQEQSSLGGRGRNGVLAEPDEFFAAVVQLDSLIDAAGSEVHLYMTWAKERIPGQTDALARAYTDAGEMTGASVAPVGLAWARVRKERPDLGLYQSDGSHPSELGSYLAACVIYSQLTGRSAEGAPSVITGGPWRNGGAGRAAVEAATENVITLVSLDPDDARYLQRVAWEVVEDYRLSKAGAR